MGLVSAIRECDRHGDWVDDTTTLTCPECIAEILAVQNAHPGKVWWAVLGKDCALYDANGPDGTPGTRLWP
jgi:hypothetical protein